jgi:transglutaminase/protease-like cytokinesis protein 3
MNKIGLVLLATVILTLNFYTVSYAENKMQTQFKQDFLYAVQEYDEVINCSDYKLTTTDVGNLISELIAEESSMFCIDIDKITYSLTDANFVDDIYISYIFDQSEMRYAKAKINAEINSIVTLTEGHSDYDKVKIVYDYFVDNYNFSASDNQKYDIYNLFVEKQGVCSSFALAYKEVLDRLDIPCKVVVNKTRTHEWNKVYINNSWLNIDCSRGEQLKQIIDGSQYRTFLKSDTFFGSIYDTDYEVN